MIEISSQILSGAIAMAFLTIGLFFLRFWKKTSDLFFLAFAASFWILSFERTLLPLYRDSEFKPFIYIMRLLAFILIIIAVIYKNAPKRDR